MKDQDQDHISPNQMEHTKSKLQSDQLINPIQLTRLPEIKPKEREREEIKQKVRETERERERAPCLLGFRRSAAATRVRWDFSGKGGEEGISLSQPNHERRFYR